MNLSDMHSMTGDVGTAFYQSPELSQERLQTTAVRYDFKVDIYSLGVILFEMCYPMGTLMERAETIVRLRTRETVLPPTLLESQPDICVLLRSMLSHDPKVRPSTSGLLENKLLPAKMEDDFRKVVAGQTLFFFDISFCFLLCLFVALSFLSLFSLSLSLF